MPTALLPYLQGLYYTTAVLVAAWFLHSKIHSLVVQNEEVHNFIEKLKTNHLPHIDEALQAIAAKLKVEYHPMDINKD